jgi:hypothetical protein
MVSYWSPKRRASEVKRLGENVQELSRKVEVGRLSAPPNIAKESAELEGELKGFSDVLTAHRKKVEALEEQNKASARTLRAVENEANKIGFVIRAIHARDAGKRIKENDGIVCTLGPKLLSAAGYDNNRDHWRSDYRAWEDALSTIDAYIASWMRDGHNPPFLPVRSNELQRCHDMPPDFIREDAVAFKTVSEVVPVV